MMIGESVSKLLGQLDLQDRKELERSLKGICVSNLEVEEVKIDTVPVLLTCKCMTTKEGWRTL